MDLDEAKLALCAWLGAMLDRVRSGKPPVPGLDACDESNGIERIDSDANSFGAICLAYISDWKYSEIPNSPVLDGYLREIHARIRHTPYEPMLWAALTQTVPTSLPKEVALDLVQRDIAVSQLGHRLEHDEVLWYIADRVPEAVEGLAIRRYRSDAYTTDRIEEVLYAFPRWEQISRILVTENPSSPEKANWLVRQIRSRNMEAVVLKVRKRWHDDFARAWEKP